MMTPADAARLLAADPARSGLFCDLDGTLSPIVDDPQAARLAPGAAEALAALAPRLGLVALVSGRPARFLLDHARIPGVELCGLYGMEEVRDGRIKPRAGAAPWEPVVDDAKAQLAIELGGCEGVWVEDKGRAVAVHWRNAADRQAAAQTVRRAVAALAQASGLRAVPGKHVVELRPPGTWDKGSAIEKMIEESGVRACAFVGDDLGDLAGFSAVRARGGVAVGVAHAGETPRQVIDQSDVLLDGTAGVVDWLRLLGTMLAP